MLTFLHTDILVFCFRFLDLFSLQQLLATSQFIAWHARLDVLWLPRWREITSKWARRPSTLNVGNYTLELPPKSAVYRTLIACLQNLCFYCGRTVKSSLEGPNTCKAFGHMICRLCSGEQLAHERAAIMLGLSRPFYLPHLRCGPMKFYKRAHVLALVKQRTKKLCRLSRICAKSRMFL